MNGRAITASAPSISRSRPSIACYRAGIDLPKEMPLAEKLVETQRLMAAGDELARAIYESISGYQGYAVAQDCNSLRHVLVLGRVMSGEGGDVILSTARQVLKETPRAGGERACTSPAKRKNGTGRRWPRPACPLNNARGWRRATCRGWAGIRTTCFARGVPRHSERVFRRRAPLRLKPLRPRRCGRSANSALCVAAPTWRSPANSAGVVSARRETRRSVAAVRFAIGTVSVGAR